MTLPDDDLEPPRCPRCGALTPPSSTGRPAEWCSLCHAPLGAATHADPVDASEQFEVPIVSDPVASTLPAPPPSGAPLPPPAVDDRLIDQMLVELKATDTDPLLGRARRFESRRSRVLLGVAVGAGVVVLLLLLATVAGLFLT